MIQIAKNGRVAGQSQQAQEQDQSRGVDMRLHSQGAEVAEIRLENVDFKARTMRVFGKGRTRIVPFGRKALKAIVNYVGGRREEYLFTSDWPRQFVALSKKKSLSANGWITASQVVSRNLSRGIWAASKQCPIGNKKPPSTLTSPRTVDSSRPRKTSTTSNTSARRR